MPMQNQEDQAPGIRLTAEAYFPTLIFFRDLPNGPELNARLKPAIYNLREEDPAGLVRSNVAKVGSWHSPDDLATRPAFAEFSREVVLHASIVFGELGYDPDCGPEISNMWAMVHPRHGYNRSHTHPNVLWSGVYYVQSPPRAGRIVFVDPRVQALANRRSIVAAATFRLRSGARCGTSRSNRGSCSFLHGCSTRSRPISATCPGRPATGSASASTSSSDAARPAHRRAARERRLAPARHSVQ